MRVRFLRDYTPRGEASYLKGAVVDIDDGLALDLIELDTVKAFPRTSAELREAATKYYPGDENRTARQKAERAANVVVLTGDTQSDTEAQLGESDPHALRAEQAETAVKAEKATEVKKP